MTHLGLHSEVARRERERERVRETDRQAWGSAFIGVSLVHSLFVNLKCKSWN